MKIIDTISASEKIKKGSILTIGNFDGVHIGHQQIICTAKKIAARKKTELVAMTFEPHPFAVLHPEKGPGILTIFELKKKLLADCGVDSMVVLKDSAKLLRLSPEGFVDNFLMKTICPSVVVEGDDFNFGQGRSGNIETLKELGKEKGFDVLVVEPKQAKLGTGQTVKVSSTVIRYMLESGHVSDAAVALGRPYRLIEKIVPGRGKGRELGFPTLNLNKPAQVIPAEGVYAGFVELNDTFEKICTVQKHIPAVFSIGQARTYGPNHPLLIEAHLLVENVGDYKGKWMAMDFIEHLRPQHKFENENQLANQIAKDCKVAKKILANKIK
jgi:riboflavin kinase / FMN adenylyltransferase